MILRLSALLHLLLVVNADAAVLIEARDKGEPLRLVIDWQAGRVRVERPDASHLVDLERGWIYELGNPAARTPAFLRPGYEEPPPWRLDVFGPGPIRAGHATTYHVLFLGEDVCAEVLASPWMVPFTDPAVQAVAMLDRLEGEPSPAVAGCADAPITTLGAAGWPLLVGKVDRPTLETRRIDFDYRAEAEELAVPAPFNNAEPPDVTRPAGEASSGRAGEASSGRNELR